MVVLQIAVPHHNPRQHHRHHNRLLGDIHCVSAAFAGRSTRVPGKGMGCCCRSNAALLGSTLKEIKEEDDYTLARIA